MNIDPRQRKRVHAAWLRIKIHRRFQETAGLWGVFLQVEAKIQANNEQLANPVPTPEPEPTVTVAPLPVDDEEPPEPSSVPVPPGAYPRYSYVVTFERSRKQLVEMTLFAFDDEHARLNVECFARFMSWKFISISPPTLADWTVFLQHKQWQFPDGF